jgi:hypothetical protein
VYRAPEKREGLRVNRVPDKYKETRAYTVQKNWVDFGVMGGGGRCTRWRSWLRHCATSQKVACSITDTDKILPTALWPWC